MEATDPRDRIYTLLTLYAMWIPDYPTKKLSFTPDYKKAVPEVYGDFIRCFITLPRNSITREGSLRIILRSEVSPEKDYDLAERDCRLDETHFPSWVPRWDLCLEPWCSTSRDASAALNGSISCLD
jgi:hypothetical protein